MASHKHEFHPLDPQNMKRIQSHFKGYKHELYRTKPEGWVLAQGFVERAKNASAMQVRPDDVWLLGYPKTGTTWTQEMIWCICNDCNFEEGKKGIMERFPILETEAYIDLGEYSPKRKLYSGLLNMLPNTKRMAGIKAFSSVIKQNQSTMLQNMESPRFIKTHLPISLLPESLLDTCKVVYVARNPKDTLSSRFHHFRLFKFHRYDGDFEFLLNLFLDDLTIYDPFPLHVMQAWNLRDHPNMCFLFYEDLKKDLEGSIKKLSKFLNKTLDENDIVRLKNHLSFDSFKKNPAVNFEGGKTLGFINNNGHFIRKGIVGDYKNHFTPEMEKKMNEWIKERFNDPELIRRFIDEDKQPSCKEN